MKSVSIGNDDFSDLIKSNSYYVDKTNAIEELLKNNKKVVLYTRPRRFGKSLFISMLEHFFDIDESCSNKDLFKGLYISKSPYFSEFGSFPVISLTFKNLKQNTYDEVYEQFVMLIEKLYTEKSYVLEVLDEDEKNKFKRIKSGQAKYSEYQDSLFQLSIWLERYHQKKVVILIDEYDAPIQSGYLNGFYDKVINLIRSVFSACLKTNKSLKMGVLTGVLRVSKESIFSDLNNLKVYDMMSLHYLESFGFTEKETKELLEYYGLELTSDVKNFYDGYSMNGVSIYNPWSILNYADEKILNSYWINTSGNDLIIKLLSETSKEVKIDIEKLATGESISFTYNDKLTYLDLDKKQSKNNILNLMYASGYLTIDQVIDEAFRKYSVKIPNEEVKIFILKIISYAYANDVIDEYVSNFGEALKNDNKEEMEKSLNKMLESMSYMVTCDNFYHGYMLGIFQGFLRGQYIVKSNREGGLGRFDVLIEKKDRNFGCIFEFKIAEKESEMENLASLAKKQMKEKEYYKELQLDKVENIKEYALVFYEKKCVVR